MPRCSTTGQALALANRLEGHPDNVAPALLGGFVVSGQAGDVVWAQDTPVDDTIFAIVLVPPYGVRTEVARGLLPEVVPHEDAVANTGRAALLVVALGGQPALLLRATEDFLHQEQREPAMPESIALVHDLRSRGVPAVISGAGPTVLALVAEGVTPGARGGRRPRSDRVADTATVRRRGRSPRANLSEASTPGLSVEHHPEPTRSDAKADHLPTRDPDMSLSGSSSRGR